jgi:hypothetical protein
LRTLVLSMPTALPDEAVQVTLANQPADCIVRRHGENLWITFGRETVVVSGQRLMVIVP